MQSKQNFIRYSALLFKRHSLFCQTCRPNYLPPRLREKKLPQADRPPVTCNKIAHHLRVGSSLDRQEIGRSYTQQDQHEKSPKEKAEELEIPSVEVAAGKICRVWSHGIGSNDAHDAERLAEQKVNG